MSPAQIEELNQVEQGLVIDKVDPRINASFHDAVSISADRMVCAVGGAEFFRRRSFEVLPQLEAERCTCCANWHISHRRLDSAASALHRGIGNIYEEVQALYRDCGRCDLIRRR